MTRWLAGRKYFSPLHQVKAGFTLVELLVSVSIFSGVVVLTLGAFARSADSSARSGLIREKTEAARTVIDRIGNDIEYVYTKAGFKSAVNTQCMDNPALQYGYVFSVDCLYLVLQYPNNGPSELTAHKYWELGGKIYFSEQSGCSIVNGLVGCQNASVSESNLLGDSYIYDGDKFIDGIYSNIAVTNNESPLIKVTVTIKPNDDVNKDRSCVSSVNPDCYTVKSSFVPGA